MLGWGRGWKAFSTQRARALSGLSAMACGRGTRDCVTGRWQEEKQEVTTAWHCSVSQRRCLLAGSMRVCALHPRAERMLRVAPLAPCTARLREEALTLSRPIGCKSLGRMRWEGGNSRFQATLCEV